MPSHSALKSIREFLFPSTDPYLLDMFGGLFPNPQDPGSPLIECLLTPCTPRTGAAVGLSRKISEQVRVGVGVGNLTNLYVGRFVQNGLFTSDYPLADHRLEQITFEIDARTLDFTEERFIDEIPFDDTSAPISIRQSNS